MARARADRSDGIVTPVTSDLLVRPAQDGPELEAAGAICVAAYADAGQLDPGDPYEVTLRDAAERARTAVVLVAERGGTLVGTVTICPPGSVFHEVGHPDEVEFRFLAVLPAAWGSGVGEALVAACEQHARARGAGGLVLSVRDINIGARRMYERLGFVAAPERDWSPVPGVDLQVMTRPLP